MGVFNFVGTLGSGWLTDRTDPRKLLLIYYGFRGVSLLFLPFVHDSMGIFVFSILFGLDYIATVPPTVQLCADAFGRRNVAIVYGWVFAAHMFGAAIAAWAAGIVRENVGDYAAAFVAAGWIAIVAGFAALGIRRGGRRPSRRLRPRSVRAARSGTSASSPLTPASAARTIGRMSDGLRAHEAEGGDHEVDRARLAQLDIGPVPVPRRRCLRRPTSRPCCGCSGPPGTPP